MIIYDVTNSQTNTNESVDKYTRMHRKRERDEEINFSKIAKSETKKQNLTS
jgi:hypothetical protein